MADRETLPSFEAALAALREEFCAGLPDRLAGLQQHWVQWQQTQDPETLHSFHRAAHSLTGAGATFGFQQLSQKARELERLLKPAVEGGDLPHLSIDTALEAVLSADLSEPVKCHDGRRTEDLLAVRRVTTSMPPIVYVADENPVFLGELAAQLGHFGLEVTTFGGLYDVRDAVEMRRPDLVLMNAQLPGLEEDEVYAVTRALSDELVPVILLSSQTDFVSRLQAVRAGAAGFSSLPVDMASLIALIDRFANRFPPEPFRVLLIDDEPEVGRLHAALLEEAGMVALVLRSPADVQTGIDGFSPDVIVTDLYMPEISGVDMAMVLRQQDRYDSIPIVFLSAEQDGARQQIAIGSGADDFIAKPVVPRHFVASIRSRATRARALRAAMTHDGMTGLLNRRTISASLDREFARAARTDAPLSVAMLDVDHFKRINDTHGHPAGDRVLRALARLMRRRIRQTDYAGRYGGEEFMLVFPDTDKATACRVIDKLRDVFVQLTHTSDQGVFTASFSAGVADAPSVSSVEELVRAADAALYRAKQEGRNRVVLA